LFQIVSEEMEFFKIDPCLESGTFAPASPRDIQVESFALVLVSVLNAPDDHDVGGVQGHHAVR
jgi:hypothetical protein